MSNIYATYEGVKAGVYQTLVTIECYKCHILFAMPEDLNRRALSSPNLSFYCPLGHSQCYTETEEQRLKKKLEQEQARSARLTSQVDQARARAEHEEHRARAYKGQVTKIKKRVGLLRHDGLTIGRSFAPAAWLSTRRCRDRIVDTWRATAPVTSWLDRHVGPSVEAPPEAR